ARTNPVRFEREVVPAMQQKYQGFVKLQTTPFYHQYNIQKAKELQDFYHEYEKKVHLVNAVEGRLGTSRQLKEDDFYKLFFEAEPSSGGNTGLTTPRPWPPRVIRKRHTYEIVRPGEREEVVDLFKTAERPILFWRTADKSAGVPKTMGEVREEVLAAWKTYEA